MVLVRGRVLGRVREVALLQEVELGLGLVQELVLGLVIW